MIKYACLPKTNVKNRQNTRANTRDTQMNKEKRKKNKA